MFLSCLVHQIQFQYYCIVCTSTINIPYILFMVANVLGEGDILTNKNTHFVSKPFSTDLN